MKTKLCEHCQGTGKVLADIDLTLTPDEAKAVADVLAYCGGHRFDSRRKFTDKVVRKLRDAGYAWGMNGNDGIDGRITFKSE